MGFDEPLKGASCRRMGYSSGDILYILQRKILFEDCGFGAVPTPLCESPMTVPYGRRYVLRAETLQFSQSVKNDGFTFDFESNMNA